jgi:hypothetical protein
LSEAKHLVFPESRDSSAEFILSVAERTSE